ncbi:MAG: nickel pincer cofactor biosynthesis protein LarC [Actinomycetota bacterium]
MRLIYFDCINGASGDMILGSLLDAGAPRATVVEALTALGLDDAITIEDTTKRSIRATKVRVDVSEQDPSRSYGDIVAILRAARLDPRVKQRSLVTFERLADAEATIHGVPLDDVHFHEVGGTDAIVDVVGACAALEHFAPDRVIASWIPTGRGFTQSLHGTIPIPAPAVAELLTDAVLFERGSDELVTPTGAALLASWCDNFGELPPLRIEAVGYGAGTLDTEIPNVVRVLVGEQEVAAHAGDRTELIETNVDDMAPELLPYVIERLMGAGALDAWVTPILMKKGRHGVALSVLCDPATTKGLLDIIFTETSTLGVRVGPVDREILDRKETEVEVQGQRIRVKLGIRHGRVVTVAPEYEDAAAVARITGLPLKDVYDLARRSLPPESAP